MAYVLASVLAAAVGTVALLSAFAFWITKRALAAKDDVAAGSASVLKLSLDLQQRTAAYDALSSETDALAERFTREVAARKTAEEMLNDVVTHLNANCPPEILADSINRDLYRLREMVSEEDGMSEVPAGNTDRGADIVHGTITTPDSSDGVDDDMAGPRPKWLDDPVD